MPEPEPAASVGLVMGSESDWPTMEAASTILADFGVPFETRVLSAHRTPQAMTDYAETAAGRGLKVIIAGAGGSAHLPGMIAASTTLPVIGVPVATKSLRGLDALLAIVQMPGGVPVATVAVGQARNAGLLAVQILATADERLAKALVDFKAQLKRLVAEMDERVRGKG